MALGKKYIKRGIITVLSVSMLLGSAGTVMADIELSKKESVIEDTVEESVDMMEEDVSDVTEEDCKEIDIESGAEKVIEDAAEQVTEEPAEEITEEAKEEATEEITEEDQQPSDKPADEQTVEEQTTEELVDEQTVEEQTTEENDLSLEAEENLLDGGIIDSAKCGDNLNWTLYSTGTLVISGTGAMYDYFIYYVDDDDLYYYADAPWSDREIKTVEIQKGVTSIGDGAFKGCSSLTNITIPESVTHIGRYAFDGCSSLSSIAIPKGVTTIGDHVLSHCSSLNSIIVDSGNPFFDSRNGCNAIIESASGNLIAGCNTTTIPEGVTSIGDYAFYGCSSLSSITIPEGVMRISDYAFIWCNNLTNITIPESITTIGEGAFYFCSSLKSITIPKGVTIIGDYAFFSCNSLSNVIIPENVTAIGDYAFCGCNRLRSITIPESVTTIEDKAFLKCINLIIYGYTGTTAQTYAEDHGIPFRSIDSGLILITNAVVAVNDQVYSGAALTPSVRVTLNGETLVEDMDYSVVYSNNINVGTATATITGIGYYEGTASGTFTINKADQTITAKPGASSVPVGRTTTITVTGAKGKKSFASSDKTIAAVSTDGKVTMKKVGTVKITVTSAATTNYKKATKTVTIKVLPAATSSVTSANLATGIKVGWKKVTGAKGYYVYRNNLKIKDITSRSTVSYTDTKANSNGTKYVYKVVAYAGTGKSTLSNYVTVYRVSRPAISSLKNTAAGKVTVKWGTNAKGSGYQIQYSTSKSFDTKKTITITNKNTGSKVIAGFTKGKPYYVRVRTYKTVNGKKYYSAWSAIKSVKITK